jgi:hypothetical protein
VAHPVDGARLQTVAPLHLARVARQLAEAGDAEHLAGDAPVAGEQTSRRHHFAQDGAAAQQPHLAARLRHRVHGEPVHPVQQVGMAVGLERPMLVVLVHQREVVELVAPFLEHAPHGVVDDHGHLAGEAGVPGAAGGHRRGHHQARAVLVLQALAAERRAARRGAE